MILPILPLLFAAGALTGQLPDAPYEETPPEIVERMLHLADLHPGDVVYDLGCGDGRIVIAAVRRRGVRGVCVELDPARLKWAREVAEEAGVSNLIRFVQGDLFEVPIEDATVVTLYLMRPANLRLKPRLLRELRPGTRVLSYRFDMGNWEAERTEKVGDREIYRWTIPEPGPLR
jgi:ubiquinone/menaquinone biosynthesis C-methylase UbiE